MGLDTELAVVMQGVMVLDTELAVVIQVVMGLDTELAVFLQGNGSRYRASSGHSGSNGSG